MDKKIFIWTKKHKWVMMNTMAVHNFSSYLTYSEEDLKWQIVCHNAGYTEILPGQPYPLNINQHPDCFKSVATGRTLNEFQLVYITAGRGQFSMDGARYDIIPGSVMLVFPGVRHSYSPEKEKGWTEYWVGFSGTYADNLKNSGVLNSGNCYLFPGLQESLIEIFLKIFKQLKEQKPGYQIRCGADTISLLAESVSFSRIQNQKSEHESIVEKTKFILHENLYDNMDLGRLSEMLKLNKGQLNTIFKSYTGMTPYQYFLNIKINKAKEWLDYDVYSVKEIALSLSFSDPLYFTRLFKKKTGVSPTKWRIYN